MTTISETLKRYRKKKKLTQLELAFLLETTPGTVSRWETEKQMPSTFAIQMMKDKGVVTDGR